MNSFWRTIQYDLYRHEDKKGVWGFITGLFKPGFRYTLLWRLTSSMHTLSPIGIILRLLKRRYRLKYGFEISKSAQIGEGFYLSDHVGPVVIGPVKIGKYCNIGHLVTIGRAFDKSGKIGRPTLGDRVWIGTGAVLSGKINIGSNVMIAPNSFVNFDVPDHSIVIGNPGKIIRKENPTKYYICHLPEGAN